jgi:UDP-glucuronate decarboxylase
MRALITGGAGFIGSHLCEFLLGRGARVVCMDNFITGSPENIAHLEGRPDFARVCHDVTQYIDVEGPLDWVLHFASPASPRDYLELPIQTLKVGALGTHRALGVAKAKGARFLLASTSEVYGDPLVHPQREEYWGNVNPVGPRGVYDEAKRFAEALTMAYHRAHGLDTRIVRIFNSIPGDEFTLVFDNDDMRFCRFEDYARTLEIAGTTGRKIQVPAFDPVTGKVTLQDVSAIIKHPCQGDIYEVKTRYGRTIRVTGDHSLFRRGHGAQPEPVFAKDLKPGDDVAIASVLPAIEKDFTEFSLSGHLLATRGAAQLWDYAIASNALRADIESRREEIHGILARSGRLRARRFRNGLSCASNKYRRLSLLPLAVVRALGIAPPPDAVTRIFKAGAHIAVPDLVTVTDEILWLLGFFLAEGYACRRGKNCYLSFASDTAFLEKAARILETHFKVHAVRRAPKDGRAPAVVVNSHLLYIIFDEVFRVLGDAIPAWILQLPLHRLKWFLEGYREGDGTHSGKKLGKELCFDTASEQRARDLTIALLRFGIVASVGQYETTFKKKYGERRFPFYRLTVCELSNFNVLEWDRGVVQRLNARRTGDLVWARVRSVEKSVATPWVYDFSVPGAENFLGGNGVWCHNTHGPRMRLHDGRAIPAFITQALGGQPITVFGDGSQTRSFQYIDDLVEGIRRLMEAPVHNPVNIGNPQEITLLELAKRILWLTGSRSEIVFRPLPVDDPKVRQPDITRARALLGWEPQVDIDEGLRLTIDWFREKLGR